MNIKITPKTITGLLLLLLLSGIFVYSALSKLNSIEPFEWTFMDMVFSNTLAYFAARLMIGFELLIALFLVGHFYLKKFTYPITIIFLVAMSIYLIVLLITKGNNMDCGCFGDELPMTPLQSILKNIVMLAMVFILKKIYPVKPYPYQDIFASAGAVVMIAIPFIFVPNSQKPNPIDLSPLTTKAIYPPNINLQKGKHLIAFMSLGCPHCRTASKILAEIRKADSTAPVFMVLLGHPEDSSSFFDDTKSEQVPHTIINDLATFNKITKADYVPVIMWVENGVRTRSVSYIKLNNTLLNNWNN